MGSLEIKRRGVRKRNNGHSSFMRGVMNAPPIDVDVDSRNRDSFVEFGRDRLHLHAGRGDEGDGEQRRGSVQLSLDGDGVFSESGARGVVGEVFGRAAESQ